MNRIPLDTEPQQEAWHRLLINMFQISRTVVKSDSAEEQVNSLELWWLIYDCEAELRLILSLILDT